MTQKLKNLDRRRKRIYRKERRSEKWFYLNKLFKKEVKRAKYDFYKKVVEDLKDKKPGQWYQCLKKITSFDQQKYSQPYVAEISKFSAQEQAETIAENFAAIPNQYQPLKNGDVCVSSFSESEIPMFSQAQVTVIFPPG